MKVYLSYPHRISFPVGDLRLQLELRLLYLQWYSYKELALAGSLKISQYKASRDHFYYPLNIHYCKINFEGE